ncbi:MAG: RNA polymerase sigma factor, partial [Deltaproteobacteria bacterium]|nr:RNA polymerase sigma factor [Deltaproteobacteria bacterium]
IFTIASNTATDYLRSKKRWAAEAQDRHRAAALSNSNPQSTVQALVASTPQTHYEIREHIDYCFTCIAKTLPADQQMALLLRDIYDFANEEGAQVLGKSMPAFKHLVHAARQTMSRRFVGRCALINKQGVCYQCSELSEVLRGPEETRRQLDALPLQPQQSAEAQARTLDLRFRLIKVIDPLNADGTNLHHFLMRHLRAANEYD